LRHLVVEADRWRKVVNGPASPRADELVMRLVVWNIPVDTGQRKDRTMADPEHFYDVLIVGAGNAACCAAHA
jgi:hypothetical protein